MHYDHTLKKILEVKQSGNQVHNLCTNNYGFKINCKKEIKKLNKNIDIAFLGDSIVEGVGIDAEIYSFNSFQMNFQIKILKIFQFDLIVQLFFLV